ncbi:methylenetetrahydrofolate reductase [NAD(P)H] [Acetobacter farinalis]|nr:methylenetetrahydrofolate reductase [NAD(P)H] [Acetobacter farinalis]
MQYFPSGTRPPVSGFPVAPARSSVKTPVISFEFFPPKTEGAARSLQQTVATLAGFAPEFLSVTYGAGGTTRDRTLATTAEMVRQGVGPVAGHLTCVGATREDVNAVAQEYWAAGVRHIVALRGDPGTPGSRFEPHPGGYAHAADLVKGLKTVADFEISVAAYPETHPEAVSPQKDIEYLKAKLDAGATRAITQFFFVPEAFLRFRDRAVAAGITAPIVPGILPIANVAQAYKFAELCGAGIPETLRATLDGLDAHPEARAMVTTALAAELCRTLLAEGVEHLHIYTLNRAEPSYALCRLLGVMPALQA